MKAFDLNDFSAGISESLTGAPGNSAAISKGFIVDGTGGLRTQWAVDSVVASGDSAPYSSSSVDYLVSGNGYVVVSDNSDAISAGEISSVDTDKFFSVVTYSSTLVGSTYNVTITFPLDKFVRNDGVVETVDTSGEAYDIVAVDNYSNVFTSTGTVSGSQLVFNTTVDSSEVPASGSYYLTISDFTVGGVEVNTSYGNYKLTSSSASIEYAGIGDELTVVRGGIEQTYVSLLDTNFDNENIDTSNVSFSSSDPSVATFTFISPNATGLHSGIVEGHSAGTATITMTYYPSYAGGSAVTEDLIMTVLPSHGDTGSFNSNIGEFVCEVLRDGSTFSVTNSVDGVAQSSNEVVLWPDSGLLFGYGHNAANYMYVVYESSPGNLSYDTYSGANVFPSLVAHPTIPDQLIPKDGVMPIALAGTMWNDRLVLADILWYDSNASSTIDVTGGTASETGTALTSSNSKRYRNAMWISEPGNPYAYDRLSVDVPVPSNERIIDLQVCDLGLLVLSTGGLTLLRGTVNDYVVEPLTSEPPATDGLDPYVNNYKGSCWWKSAGVYVYVGQDGGVYSTDGVEVVRLDGPETIDHDYANNLSIVAADGDFLFVFHSERLLVLRKSNSRGVAWSELVLPWAPDLYADIYKTSAYVNGMWTLNHKLYVNKSSAVTAVYDLTGRSGYGTFPDGSEWGYGYTAGDQKFTFATSTIDLSTNGAGVSGTQILRAGASFATGSEGVVESIAVGSGRALDRDVVSAVTANKVVDGTDPTATLISRVGVGFVNECFFEIVATGDIVVDSVSGWAAPGSRVSSRRY